MNVMRETIILATGANKSELLRMLARFGKNTMGLRVFSRVELAKYALMRSGITVTEEFLTSKEEPSVVFSFLNEIEYFKAASYADAESLSAALSVIRSLIPDDEERVLHDRLAAGEFSDKNTAVIEVYDRYIRKITSDGRIDRIGLVRRALEKADRLSGADFMIISEFPLMPIDRALLEKLSGGGYTEISVTDLCGREKKELTVEGITEAYGGINEVESIIDRIFRKGIPLDKCIIAAANASAYSQVLYDISCNYDIPVTYGCGVPILNSNPARLLKLIYEWNTSGYYGIDALRKILSSDAFDRSAFAETLGLEDGLRRRDAEELGKMAGDIRLSFDEKENKKRLANLKSSLDKDAESARKNGNEKAIKSAEYKLKVFEWTSRLANELESGCIRFLSKYAIIRAEGEGRVSDISGRIDQSAMSVITETMEAYMRYAPEGDINEIIPDILRKTVCSENSREGCLHITSISGALSCLREHLYICGLGSPSENYLILDSDLLLLADQETAPTSENRVRQKTKTFFDLLEFASAAEVETNLTYSGYSLSELKEHNPSSALFSVYEMIHPEADMEAFKNSLKHAPYFESCISPNRLIGDKYSSGAELSYRDISPDKDDPAHALDRAWSPSALSNYLQCPRHFYLANVLGIPERESDDPFEILSAAVTGTLAHTMMEKLADEKYGRQEFLDMSSELFDDALSKRPPVHPSDAEALKKEFLKMMETSFDMDPHNSVVSAEEEYRFQHPSGIWIHGYPDRVERDDDGRYLIADFKTKRKKEHVQDDFGTCMQVIVYAWLCEQAGIDISSCEYRYLRKGMTVTCRYDDGMKDHLDGFLIELRESIENNDFPRIESAENCKYCKMADICRWTEDNEGKEGTEDD